jgi:hypothetical protein
MSKGGNNKGNGEIKRSHFLLIVFLVLIIVILGLLIFSKKKNNASAFVCTKPSNIYLLKEAANYLNPSKPEKLSPITDKIMKLNNYINDPNCDYVLLNYYLNFDSNKAQYYFNELNKSYESNIGYSPTIRTKTVSKSTLETQIINLKNYETQLKNNSLEVKNQ